MRYLGSALLFLCLCFSFGIASAQLVIYIGDSHSAGPEPNGGFGPTMNRLLSGMKRSNGQKLFNLRSSLTCGANATWWLKDGGWNSPCGPAMQTSSDVGGGVTHSSVPHSSSLADLINENSRIGGTKLLLIEAGTNQLGARLSDNTDKNVTERLIDLAKGHGFECIWIGPPQLGSDHWTYPNSRSGFSNAVSQYEAYNDMLQATVEAKGCTYIDSNLLTDRRQLESSTAYHYNFGAASRWAQRVFSEQLSSQLREIFEPAGAPENQRPSRGDSEQANPAQQSDGGGDEEN